MPYFASRLSEPDDTRCKRTALRKHWKTSPTFEPVTIVSGWTISAACRKSHGSLLVLVTKTHARCARFHACPHAHAYVRTDARGNTSKQSAKKHLTLGVIGKHEHGPSQLIVVRGAADDVDHIAKRSEVVRRV